MAPANLAGKSTIHFDGILDDKVGIFQPAMRQVSPSDLAKVRGLRECNLDMRHVEVRKVSKWWIFQKFINSSLIVYIYIYSIWCSNDEPCSDYDFNAKFAFTAIFQNTSVFWMKIDSEPSWKKHCHGNKNVAGSRKKWRTGPFRLSRGAVAGQHHWSQ